MHYTVTTFDTAGNEIQTSQLYTMKPLQSYVEEQEENADTILISGQNVKNKLTSDYSYAAIGSNGYSYILNDYALYSTNAITEQPTITISVPEDGAYYVYANMRSGHSTYQPQRSLTLTVTQNGTEIPVEDVDGSTMKFGFSADFRTLGSEIINAEFFCLFMGFRAHEPIMLTKGIAEITFSLGAYAGFDFIVLTKDASVIEELEKCQYKGGYNIYQFWAENTELQQLLQERIDIASPAVPTIAKKSTESNTPGVTLEITDTEASPNMAYNVYVNGNKYTSVSKRDAILSDGVELTDLNLNDSIQVSAIDRVGNESALSNALYVDRMDIWYPSEFSYLNSGENYTSVQQAESSDALPDGFMLMLTQDNLEKTDNATKVDTNLFTGQKDNYYVKSSQFKKVFTGSFVIPEGEETYYQFISSYLRVHSTGTKIKDDRRTHFILVDGYAVTKDGLKPWNGQTSYNMTDYYGTNSYVFGSEYPHEFTPDDDPQNTNYLCQNYPHTVVRNTAHLWGYSPAVRLSPGLHTVEVYSVGASGWFNNLFITSDIGYDITKLLYGGLPTRATGWVNNYNTVLKPLYTDFVQPVFSQSADISIVNDEGLGTLEWTPATDAGLGASGQNLCYIIEAEDSSGNIQQYQSMTNSLELSDLQAGTEYTFRVTAYDSAGNASGTITKTAATFTPAVQYEQNETQSIIYFNPQTYPELVGKCAVYLAAYNRETKQLCDLHQYMADISVDGTKTISFENPMPTDNTFYKIFVWKYDTLNPLVDVITPEY